MKKITIFFLFFGNVALAQLGVDFHQSNLPFLGVNYEFGDKWRPEIRIGTDNYFEDVSPEFIATYDILNKADYEFYAGLGVKFNTVDGFVIPVGLNIFPFSNKKFGFQIELSPIISGDGRHVLRGSWGIRYRFLKDNQEAL